jgi:capsid protein
MSFLNRLAKWTGFATTGGYDAAKQTNRRRMPATNLDTEDKVLKGSDRKVVVASARDIRRNFATARWMIDKHLDFVVSHNFRSRSGDRDFDRELERFVERLMMAENFDVTGRHPHRRFMRMLEASRVIDGDILVVKVASESGAWMQAIEGDRVRDPGLDHETTGQWIQGLRVGPYGRVSQYAVHKRTGAQSFEFERAVGASRAIWFGYFDRFDQYRGVPLIASAINTLTGLYEGFDYALAKSKIAQLFALSIYREAETDWGGGIGDDDGNNAGSSTRDYNIDFSKGPIFLDLNPGEKAEFLEGNTPGANTADFWQTLIAVSLKSLGIPYSFYDEAHTNFFGAKSALILYQKSVRDKQRDIQEFNDTWLKWRLGLAIQSGEFVAPAGYDPEEMQWQWIPEGIPWWNPGDEVKANIEAINAGLKSRAQVRMETDGDDWRDVIDELAEEQKYMQESGVDPNPELTAKKAEAEAAAKQQNNGGSDVQKKQSE